MLEIHVCYFGNIKLEKQQVGPSRRNLFQTYSIIRKVRVTIFVGLRSHVVHHSSRFTHVFLHVFRLVFAFTFFSIFTLFFFFFLLIRLSFVSSFQKPVIRSFQLMVTWFILLLFSFFFW